MDYIRKYIFNILNFFKSYKVDVIHSNIILKFDDRLQNKVMIIDKLMMNYNHTFTDKAHVSECIKFLNHFNWKEDIGLLERLYLDITYWKERHFIEYVPLLDAIKEILITYGWHDHIRVTDIVPEYSHTYEWRQKLPIRDDTQLDIDMTKKDIIKPIDSMYMTYTTDLDPFE